MGFFSLIPSPCLQITVTVRKETNFLGPAGVWRLCAEHTQYCNRFWKVREKGVSEDIGEGKEKKKEKEEKDAHEMLSKTKEEGCLRGLTS